ncbi:MAG: TonB-dependent receptor [Elusimicrobia bacterium]|nr:TonB-dependent receptor [Elusimicrobiota bacterium]
MIGPLFALLFLAAPNAAAGEGEPETAFTFFEEEAKVVAASKLPQPLSQAPANAFVITAADIELYGWRTLGEAMQSVPGFYVISDRNYSYLWVRGFGRPGDYTNRVLLQLNGHRMNDNVYGGSYWLHDSSFDIRTIERVEVIKGPGSALHGDNAVFAVVNVITKKAGQAPLVEAAAEIGAYRTHKEFVGVSRSFADGGGLYAAASYRVMGGQDHRYSAFAGTNGGLFANGDREESYTLYSLYEKNGVFVHGSASNRNKRIPTASYGTLFNDNGSHTADARSFMETGLEKSLGRDWTLNTRGYWDWYRYDADYIYTHGAPNKDLGRNHWIGDEVRATYAGWGRENTFMIGQDGEINLEALQRNHNEAPFALNLDTNKRNHRWALFAQQELKVRDDLRLTLGLRFDRYQQFGNTVNPRMAAVWKPRDEDTFKFLYGSAFRAPTPYELYYNSAGYEENPTLKPETVRTYEAVYEHRFGRTAWASVSYFRTEVRSLMTQITNPNGNFQFVNRESIYTDGAELAARAELGRGAAARLAYILQGTRELGGDRLSNSPTHAGTAGLSQRFYAHDASAALECFFVSSRRTVRSTTLAPTALLSLNLRARPWRGSLSVYAGLFNLADVDYRAAPGNELTQDAISMDGRNFNAGLEYRFGGRR